MTRNQSSRTKKVVTLWVVQGLLAALFLFAGGMKLAIPADALAQQAHMSGTFLKFIGLAEVLGAVGLVLPVLLNIKPRLTSVAAAGLLIIMIGAVSLSIPGGLAAISVPLAVGLLSAFVAHGRWQPAV